VHAVRLHKKLIRTWEDLPTRAAIETGIEALVSAWETDAPPRAMSEVRAARDYQNS
jgi:enoyl-CoA hydratase